MQLVRFDALKCDYDEEVTPFSHFDHTIYLHAQIRLTTLAILKGFIICFECEIEIVI